VNARAILAALAASLAVFFAASAQAGACTGAGVVPDETTVARARSAALCLVNAQRRRRGKHPLRTSAELQRSAAAYARTMVRDRFFSHVTPSGLTFVERIRRGTHYLDGAWSWRVGENLAWGVGRRATPAGIVAGWMASPAHRRVLLDGAFREMGMGIAPGAPVDVDGSAQTATYVNQFGRRGS
jgi:uncharacterized protein YkwD